MCVRKWRRGGCWGGSPSFPCALGEASVMGITLCQKSSVSVAWLVMPIHWIRDEHTVKQQNTSIFSMEKSNPKVFVCVLISVKKCCGFRVVSVTSTVDRW